MERVKCGLVRKESLFSLYSTEIKAGVVTLGALLAIVVFFWLCSMPKVSPYLHILQIVLVCGLVAALAGIVSCFILVDLGLVIQYEKYLYSITRYATENEGIDLGSMIKYIQNELNKKRRFLYVFNCTLSDKTSVLDNSVTQLLLINYGVYLTNSDILNWEETK